MRRRVCLDSLSRINNRRAKDELLRISQDKHLDPIWKERVLSSLREQRPTSPTTAAIDKSCGKIGTTVTLPMAGLIQRMLQTRPARLRLHLVILSSLLILVAAPTSFAQVKRLVVLKVDGLPYAVVDRAVQESPRTGKSQLPWIEHVFYQRGARLSNFYVRGMSLSAPSWSLLDTGQHLQVKGNVEYDRYTLHAYDYLNFIPFYFKSAVGSRIDSPGAEL